MIKEIASTKLARFFKSKTSTQEFKRFFNTNLELDPGIEKNTDSVVREILNDDVKKFIKKGKSAGTLAFFSPMKNYNYRIENNTVIVSVVFRMK